jgi:hypothetical protein
MSWMRKNIKLSESRTFELLRIADAEDPYKELECNRHLNREKQKAFREKAKAEKEAEKVQRAELDPERAEIIKWAKVASLEEIHMIRELIADLHETQKAAA